MESLEKELLDLSESWKATAQEMIAKSECGSRSEMVNQMLMACAQMLEWKIKTAKGSPVSGNASQPEVCAPEEAHAVHDTVSKDRRVQSRYNSTT